VSDEQFLTSPFLPRFHLFSHKFKFFWRGPSGPLRTPGHLPRLPPLSVGLPPGVVQVSITTPTGPPRDKFQQLHHIPHLGRSSFYYTPQKIVPFLQKNTTSQHQEIDRKRLPIRCPLQLWPYLVSYPRWSFLLHGTMQSAALAIVEMSVHASQSGNVSKQRNVSLSCQGCTVVPSFFSGGSQNFAKILAVQLGRHIKYRCVTLGVFRPTVTYISQTVQVMVILRIERGSNNRKPYAIYRTVPLLMTLNDLQPNISRARLYSTMNISETVHDRHSYNGIQYM